MCAKKSTLFDHDDLVVDDSVDGYGDRTAFGRYFVRGSGDEEAGDSCLLTFDGYPDGQGTHREVFGNRGSSYLKPGQVDDVQYLARALPVKLAMQKPRTLNRDRHAIVGDPEGQVRQESGMIR